jgi:biopolymer transport protein ExbB/TolQ
MDVVLMLLIALGLSVWSLLLWLDGYHTGRAEGAAEVEALRRRLRSLGEVYSAVKAGLAAPVESQLDATLTEFERIVESNRRAG